MPAICRCIETSEHLADGLVPWSFAGMAATYLITRDVTRSLSFLMVDFSCALKLAMPVVVLSAMREANARHLHEQGFSHIIMMTGDGERTARAVAAHLPAENRTFSPGSAEKTML